MTNFTNWLLQLNSHSQLDDEQKLIMQQVINFLLEQMENGHSCIDLQNFCETCAADKYIIKYLIEILKLSGICGFYTTDLQAISPLPLTLFITDNTALLYITRYLHYELTILRKLRSLNQTQQVCAYSVLNNLSIIKKEVRDDFPNHEQLLSIQESALTQLSFITGGPGTGKTTTVLMLLLLLIRSYANNSQFLKICIVAPTGKAAIRVKQSVESTLARINRQFELTEHESNIIDNVSYSTIHKLLGFKYGSIYFKHDNNRTLDIDILIVDESSMVSLPLFYKLLLAVDSSKIKHIVFLGDKNQLSSVEEGYVFATLIEKNSTNLAETSEFKVSQLKSSNRNIGDIHNFAQAILNEKVDQISTNLITFRQNQFTNIISELFAKDNPLDIYIKAINDLTNLLLSNDIIEISKLLYSKFKDFVVLCALNNGLLGVDNLNRQIETIVKNRLNTNAQWYSGRPILVLENNSVLGIFNGDIGICLMIEGKPVILFEDGKRFIPEIIPRHQVAYAITIHKAQGSEYNNVYVVLPKISEKNKSVLTRELLYTAVTRAKLRVTLFAQEDTVNDIVKNKTERITGLKFL